MDLWVREARLFKYGSGTGSNFSRLRGEGERLSGGGKSSGLMSFLKIGDRAAGAIKSGGTTRRAAKMVVVDVDHPDIEQYVNWKVKEEQKVAALVAGSKACARHLSLIMKACVNCEGPGDDCFDPQKNPALKREIRAAKTRQRAGELHPARHPVRQAGLFQDRVPDLRPRLGFGSLSHRLRPELQQLGARHRRVPEARSKRTRAGTSPSASPARWRRRCPPASSGRRSATPRGNPPIPASSTTRRSTTGTPAGRTARSSPPTRARNTCSSTTRRAISPR